MREELERFAGMPGHFGQIPMKYLSRILVMVAMLACAASAASRPLKVIPASYPRLASLAGLQGEVRLRALISDQGDVSKVESSIENSLLSDAARRSLVQWRFEPCLQNRKCEVTITFVFVLEGLCDGECKTEFRYDERKARAVVRTKQPRAQID